MKNKIALRLMRSFIVSFLVFSLVMGGVFIMLYRTSTMNAKKAELESRAKSIAAILSTMHSDTSTGGGKGSGGMGNGMGGASGTQMGYGVFMRYLNEISGTNVWFVDQNLELLSAKNGSRQYNYSDLPKSAEKVVDEVFKGSTTFSEEFSSLMDAPTLTIGTPVRSGGTITGAILLHAPVQGITEVTAQGVKMLLLSLLAALVLSVLLSVGLSYKFTSPLRRMGSTAAILANGDYTAKTGIRQKDEIGELAEAIDSMSLKLFEAQRESEKLEKLRREFVANISHELKTPVTVLRGSLEALCDGVVTEAGQVGSYHERMLHETMYLQRLINDLLDLSRLQNSDFKIESAEMSLCDLLSDVKRSAESLASKKNIRILSKSDAQICPIRGDYGRLRQMLLIVLDNAVKFSPDGSEILVKLEDGILSVSDKGPGIPEGELPYIFDRFYKTVSEDNKSGSGLGLAIAKQIAERHGISIAAENLEGGGAKFSFDFSAIK